MFHTVIKILDSNVSLLLCLSTSFLFFSKDFLLSPFSMTSAHSTASHRVACWTTNVHPTLLQASTNWSLPSTSPTLHWLGCPGHSLPTMQWNDTRLDVFAAWVWATVISHPHLMSHAGHPCVTVLEKVAHQLDKKKKSIRGWWKFAIFPFVSSCIIRHMLVTVMVTNQMFLAFFSGAEAFLHLQQQTNQLNSKYGFRPFKLWVSICRHLRASVAKTNPYCPVHTYLHLLSLSVWDLIAFWKTSLWKSTILMTVNQICTKKEHFSIFTNQKARLQGPTGFCAHI